VFSGKEQLLQVFFALYSVKAKTQPVLKQH